MASHQTVHAHEGGLRGYSPTTLVQRSWRWSHRRSRPPPETTIPRRAMPVSAAPCPLPLVAPLIPERRDPWIRADDGDQREATEVVTHTHRPNLWNSFLSASQEAQAREMWSAQHGHCVPSRSTKKSPGSCSVFRPIAREERYVLIVAEVEHK